MADGRFLPRSLAHDERLGAVSLEADFLYSRVMPFLDCEGRTGARPSELWARTCPLRRELTPTVVEGCLRELASAGLIVLYCVEGQPFLSYPSFEVDQRGLRKDREAPSRVPAPPADAGEPSGSLALIRAQLPTTPELVPTIPDQLPLKRREAKGSKAKSSNGAFAPVSDEIDADFEKLWLVYPRRANNEDKAGARKVYRSARSQGNSRDELFAGAQRYGACMRAEEKEKTGFVMQCRRFLGPSRLWREEWKPELGGSRSSLYPFRSEATQLWGFYQEHGVMDAYRDGREAIDTMAARLVREGHRASVEAVWAEMRRMDLSALRHSNPRGDADCIKHLETRLAMSNRPPRVLSAMEELSIQEEYAASGGAR